MPLREIAVFRQFQPRKTRLCPCSFPCTPNHTICYPEKKAPEKLHSPRQPSTVTGLPPSITVKEKEPENTLVPLADFEKEGGASGITGLTGHDREGKIRKEWIRSMRGKTESTLRGQSPGNGVP